MSAICSRGSSYRCAWEPASLAFPSRKSRAKVGDSALGGEMTFLEMHWELIDGADGQKSLRMKWNVGRAGKKPALPCTNWNEFTRGRVA